MLTYVSRRIAISQTVSDIAQRRLTTASRPKLGSPSVFKTLSGHTLSRRQLRWSAIAAGNVVLVVAAVLLVAIPSHSKAAAPQAANLAAASSVVQPGALDQLASANIADAVAKMAGLDEEIFVSLQAQSEQLAMSTAAVANSDLATKPQVVETAYKSNKDIKTYVVRKGDTIESIANSFGVTSDSIRWSNNLSGNSVAAGKKLLIPPVDGIVYRIKQGDTAASLALRYNIDKAKIIQYNDAELKGLKDGELIILPGASMASLVAHGSSGIITTPHYGGFGGTCHLPDGNYPGNNYDCGFCTWWVAYLRETAGNPVPNGMHNASNWPSAARSMLPRSSWGYEPKGPGDVVVTDTSGEGHVAYVIGYNKEADTITISEMNYGGRWGVRHFRTISARGNFYIY